MFLETLVASAGIGFAAGVLATWLRAVRPLERELNDLYRNRRREQRQRQYRIQARHRHLVDALADINRAFDLQPDTHNASRKAPGLEVVK